MELRGNRQTERAAVNATRSFFEANSFVFQEIVAGNDYGKDAYVDLTEEATVTGFTVALQIKGGVSYHRTGGYGIPLDAKHETVWRGSTVPVGGIVQSPDTDCSTGAISANILSSIPRTRGITSLFLLIKS